MYDFIINYRDGDYYQAIAPRDTWRCDRCKTVWEDWGEYAEDEARPWECDGGLASREPDLGWGCPCCAVKYAPWLKLARFIEDSGFIREAVNAALTEDGEGAIEQGFHIPIWQSFRSGSNADFAMWVREYVEQTCPHEFIAWAEEEAMA